MFLKNSSESGISSINSLALPIGCIGKSPNVTPLDPNSFLPAEMKEYYGAGGITFGDFPMQPIGRAKELMDEMPDSEEFFKNMPPPPKNDKLSYPIGTLLGEYYLHKGKKVTKLGNLRELIAISAAGG